MQNKHIIILILSIILAFIVAIAGLTLASNNSNEKPAINASTNISGNETVAPVPVASSVNTEEEEENDTDLSEDLDDYEDTYDDTYEEDIDDAEDYDYQYDDYLDEDYDDTYEEDY